jgi:hypothetical protein
MMEYPAWQDMTEKQKLEFLNEWCRSMSRQIQQRGAWTNEILVGCRRSKRRLEVQVLRFRSFLS